MIDRHILNTHTRTTHAHTYTYTSRRHRHAHRAGCARLYTNTYIHTRILEQIRKYTHNTQRITHRRAHRAGCARLYTNIYIHTRMVEQIRTHTHTTHNTHARTQGTARHFGDDSSTYHRVFRHGVRNDCDADEVAGHLGRLGPCSLLVLNWVCARLCG